MGGMGRAEDMEASMEHTSSSPSEELKQDLTKAEECPQPTKCQTLPLISKLPEESVFLRGLKCPACSCLVIDEYLMCDKGGHLTCGVCVRQNPALVCQHKNKHGSSSSSTKKNQQTVENAADEAQNPDKGGPSRYGVCGAKILKQPNAFLDKVLASLHLSCPFKEQGCPESMAAKYLRKHVTRCHPPESATKPASTRAVVVPSTEPGTTPIAIVDPPVLAEPAGVLPTEHGIDTISEDPQTSPIQAAMVPSAEPATSTATVDLDDLSPSEMIPLIELASPISTLDPPAPATPTVMVPPAEPAAPTAIVDAPALATQDDTTFAYPTDAAAPGPQPFTMVVMDRPSDLATLAMVPEPEPGTSTRLYSINPLLLPLPTPPTPVAALLPLPTPPTPAAALEPDEWFDAREAQTPLPEAGPSGSQYPVAKIVFKTAVYPKPQYRQPADHSKTRNTRDRNPSSGSGYFEGGRNKSQNPRYQGKNPNQQQGQNSSGQQRRPPRDSQGSQGFRQMRMMPQTQQEGTRQAPPSSSQPPRRAPNGGEEHPSVRPSRNSAAAASAHSARPGPRTSASTRRSRSRTRPRSMSCSRCGKSWSGSDPDEVQ